MTRPLRSQPTLLSTVVLASFFLMLGIVAFLGLQVHAPARSRMEEVLEWVAFLGAIAACLGLLRTGARLVEEARTRRREERAREAEPGDPSA